MAHRDDIDGYIFFGTETENFPFPPAPEGAEKSFGPEKVDEAYFLDRLGDSDLGKQGVTWFFPCSWHEWDTDKNYIGIKIAEHQNQCDHATELTDLFEKVKKAEEKWKELFPDTPGRLLLISEFD